MAPSFPETLLRECKNLHSKLLAGYKSELSKLAQDNHQLRQRIRELDLDVASAEKSWPSCRSSSSSRKQAKPDRTESRRSHGSQGSCEGASRVLSISDVSAQPKRVVSDSSLSQQSGPEHHLPALSEDPRPAANGLPLQILVQAPPDVPLQDRQISKERKGSKERQASANSKSDVSRSRSPEVVRTLSVPSLDSDLPQGPNPGSVEAGSCTQDGPQPADMSIRRRLSQARKRRLSNVSNRDASPGPDEQSVWRKSLSESSRRDSRGSAGSSAGKEARVSSVSQSQSENEMEEETVEEDAEEIKTDEEEEKEEKADEEEKQGKSPKKGLGRVMIIGEEDQDGSSSDSSDGNFEFVISRAWMELQTKRRSGHGMAGLGIGPRRMSTRSGIPLERSSLRSEDTIRLRPSCWEAPVALAPNTNKSLVWDVACCLFIILDVFLVPMQAFGLDHTDVSMQVVYYSQAVFWTLAILVSFQTGYLDSEGKLVMSRKAVAKRYVCTQFPMDLILVTCEWLEKVVLNRTFAVAWRFAKVWRLLLLSRALDAFHGFVRSEMLKLLFSIGRFLMALLLAVHILACLWYATGILGDYLDLPCWINESVRSQTLWERYLLSVHFAISMFHGEHVALPLNSLERSFVSIVLYCVFISNLWLVSTITTAMTHLEILSTRKSSLWRGLEQWMNDNKVSPELALKVNRNAAKQLAEQEKNSPEDTVELLQLISTPLRMELHFEMYSQILDLHPFFKCFGLVNPTGIRKICHTAVTAVSLAAEDIVFREGETPHESRVYFVISGTLKYSSQKQKDASEASKASQGPLENEEIDVTNKNWISEGVLWTEDWVHMGDLRAASTDCRLIMVDAEQLQALLLSSGFAVYAKLYAEEWVELSNRMIAESSLSDLGEYSAEVGRIMASVFKDTWMQVKDIYASKIAAPVMDGRLSLSGVRGSMASRTSFSRGSLSRGSLSQVRRTSSNPSARGSEGQGFFGSARGFFASILPSSK